MRNSVDKRLRQLEAISPLPPKAPALTEAERIKRVQMLIASGDIVQGEDSYFSVGANCKAKIQQRMELLCLLWNRIIRRVKQHAIGKRQA